MIYTLSAEEILHIHNVLVGDFRRSKDPISPSGVRENGELLESAASRQTVGFLQFRKYSTPVSNAASLCFGLCCNHPFHNGNKRTALVSMLCHLDKNGFTFKPGVTQNDLYVFMIRVASHGFATNGNSMDTSDSEVRAMTHWLNTRTRRLKKDERVITFLELERILRQYDIHFENPKNNYVDLVKYQWRRRHLFAKKEWKGERVAHIPCPKRGMEVGRNVIRNVRKRCSLTEEDGYDSDIFYSAASSVDKFIVKYRGTLSRLAKT